MKIIFIIMCGLLLLQCSHHVDTSDKSENSFFLGDTYYYTYDSGGILSEERQVSYFRNGSSVDSLITTSAYIYDDKDRNILIKVIDEPEGLLSTTYFSFDQRDSLISEYTINNLGDTIYFEEHSYDNAGKYKFTKTRNLFDNLSLSTFERLIGKKVVYDTVTFLTEDFFQEGHRVRSVEKDILDRALSESEYEYKGGKLHLIKVYEYAGGDRYLMETVRFLPETNSSQLEEVAVNFLGDTTAFTHVERDSLGNLVKKVEGNIEYGNFLTSYYNNEGQLISQVELINTLGERMKKLFTYDSLGRKIKVNSVDEQLTEAEKEILTTPLR